MPAPWLFGGAEWAGQGWEVTPCGGLAAAFSGVRESPPGIFACQIRSRWMREGQYPWRMLGVAQAKRGRADAAPVVLAGDSSRAQPYGPNQDVCRELLQVCTKWQRAVA